MFVCGHVYVCVCRVTGTNEDTSDASVARWDAPLLSGNDSNSFWPFVPLAVCASC